jgi:hypothetical protein
MLSSLPIFFHPTGFDGANFGPKMLDLHCLLPAGSLYSRRGKSGKRRMWQGG